LKNEPKKKDGQTLKQENKEKAHKIQIRSQAHRDDPASTAQRMALPKKTIVVEQDNKLRDTTKAPQFQPKTMKAVDPLQGYVPPFRNKPAKPEAADKPQEPEKPHVTYTIEFIFSLKNTNKQRPENMAELNFPHKKRGANGFRKKPVTEKDKFNKTLGELRILLNKLSSSNFDVISQKLLAFQYNPSLLYELMKMIFVKSTGEHSYLDVYVRLCALLFKQFADREHHEMNFKKLLVSKCQKQFFKMLNKEREERKKRRDSLTITNDETKEETWKTEEDDGGFSKPMMYLFDDNELQQRKREQMYGNMYLITELYIAKQLNGNIIKTCLDDLFSEINDQNLEIISYMLNKLMADLVKTAKAEF
jgi:hypothetical protein